MKRLSALLLAICLSSATFALDWQMVGARQMGMGGAGVAIAQGIDAQYYNPALLASTAEEDDWEFGFTAGAQGQMIPSIYPNTEEFYTQYDTKLDANVGAGIKKGGLTFGIRSLSSYMTTPITNPGKVKADLGIFSEAFLGYAFQPLHGISLGANVKVIEGTMAEYSRSVSDWTLGFGGLMKEVWYNKKFSTSWGIDLGAAINFSELFQGNFLFDPTIAIVAKNLNNPSFKRPKNSHWVEKDYDMDRQVRIGAAIHPFTDRLTIAGDYDLTVNETLVKGKKSRQLAGGIEYLAINRHTFKLPIRAGVSRNVENTDEPLHFTAGFGTLTPDYSFEVSLTVGDSIEKINNNGFPNVMGLSMNFAWKF